jgi:hypothetical protein
MLLTIAIFLFVQNPVMGFAAMSLFPIQAYIVPRLQKRAHDLTSATDFPPKPSKHACKWCRYKDEVKRDDASPACAWGVV